MKRLYIGPSGDFEHPLEILDGCHERIRRTCGLIERIAARPVQGEIDADVRVAALDAMRFFDSAGSAHHRDEEDDLFPLLMREVSSEELNALRDLLHRLKADHKRLEALWGDMRARLRLLVEGRNGNLTPAMASAFTLAYEQHIDVEENALLPLAKRVLEPAMVRSMGERMAARRKRVVKAEAAGSEPAPSARVAPPAPPTRRKR